MGIPVIRYYLTKSGVLVEADDADLTHCKWRGKVMRWKLPCYRADTGGYHGLLWTHYLTEVRP